MRLENEALAKVIAQVRGILDKLTGCWRMETNPNGKEWQDLHQQLSESRKALPPEGKPLVSHFGAERALSGGPSSVMWSLHDDIRAGLKGISALMGQAESLSADELKTRIESKVLPVLQEMDSMIHKEEKSCSLCP